MLPVCLATVLLPQALVLPTAVTTPLHSSSRLALRTVAHSRAGSITCRDLPNIDGTGAFKNIQEYPCDLDIKVIGNNEGPFVADIVQLAAENTGMNPDDIQVRWRDNGKFRAITLRLHFENSDQVYAVYAAMDRDPRVKFKL